MSFTKTEIKKDAEKVFEKISSQVFPFIYTFGNGGSCTIANHMEVDWTKNSRGGWVVESLCANAAMLTMIANDYGYEETCSRQLEYKGLAGSFVVLVSSSGNSKNIVLAANTARQRGMVVIGFTGFDGGGLKKLSDVSVHIDSNDYGICEDYHSNVMHEVARLLKARE